VEAHAAQPRYAVTKVGHRQTPYKHQSPPREGFGVSKSALSFENFDREAIISDNGIVF
jgi:hypothetical protein